MQKQVLLYDMTLDEFVEELNKAYHDPFTKIAMINVSGYEKIGSEISDCRFTINLIIR